jgi:hypothetical protein
MQQNPIVQIDVLKAWMKHVPSTTIAIKRWAKTVG